VLSKTTSELPSTKDKVELELAVKVLICVNDLAAPGIAEIFAMLLLL
jgi:hypothetical protein